MKPSLLTAAIAALAALPTFAALKPGDPAPAFEAQASKAGQAFGYSLQAELKKGPVVVYFYPSAFTNGCNLQAHSFAVAQEKFTAAGASIVGVSLDSIARLNDFSADPESCAGKIAVASDAEGRIARAYDLAVREAAPGRKDTRGAEIDHGFAERTTFIVGTDGRIAATVGGLAPAANVEQALAAVQTLARGAPRP
ncbi:peroxiredoxin [Ideonella sp. YS5]|uniref:peroxiredoxin n=1 Tax=Ideonella sp. YS5 TaxID=3453714 RepID=UPI003EEABAB4